MNIFDMLILAPCAFPTWSVENRRREPEKFGKSYVVEKAGQSPADMLNGPGVGAGGGGKKTR